MHAAHRLPPWLVPALAAFCLLAACARPVLVPLRFDPVPWRHGEMSAYEITDRNGVYAGTYRVDLSAGARGQPGWTLRAETSAQGDQEILAVEMSEQGGLPSRTLLVRLRPAGTERVDAVWSGGQIDMTLTTAQDITTYERRHAPTDSRDERTLPTLVRALPLARGYATAVNTFNPVTARLERYLIFVEGSEQVSTPAGQFTAWKVSAGNGDLKSTFWIGTEAPHPLVKMIDARSGGVFELSAFEPGG